MLLSTITGLADMGIAERMREIAGRAGVPHEIAEQAVAEAVFTYRTTHDSADALNAGLAFIHSVKDHGADTPASSNPLAAACDRLIESVWFRGWLAMIALGLLAASAAGWLL